MHFSRKGHGRLVHAWGRDVPTPYFFGRFIHIDARRAQLQRGPAENEIKRIDLSVGLGEDGVFRADIGGNDVSAMPSLGGEHVVAGRRNEELPAALMHPVGELG